MENIAETPNSRNSSSQTANATTSTPSFVVISGGSGGNAICHAFQNANTFYILPISDDGGSSSEIIRVLGGPSIGDIRSRLVRMIPSAPTGSPLDAIRGLLAYRLPADVEEKDARAEWRDIVEGRSKLWEGIPMDRKEMIRGFLVYFEHQILKRAHKNFSFLNGSIGNYFLAGAQIFFRSLPSAIFLFSSITTSQANILPVIVTNHTVTIAAELECGVKLVGQCEISHPVPSTSISGLGSLSPSEMDSEAGSPTVIPWGGHFDSLSISAVEGMGEIIPQRQRQNIFFDQRSKSENQYERLPSRITRLYYINGYGHEIHPLPNPDYIDALLTSDVLVYSCGSLWTSIIPCLALQNIASAIDRSNSLRAKVLLLNAKNDRETDGYSALDYIQAIARTLNSQYMTPPYGIGSAYTTYPVSRFLSHVVYLKGSRLSVDVRKIESLGIKTICVENPTTNRRTPQFDAATVRQVMDDVLMSTIA